MINSDLFFDVPVKVMEVARVKKSSSCRPMSSSASGYKPSRKPGRKQSNHLQHWKWWMLGVFWSLQPGKPDNSKDEPLWKVKIPSDVAATNLEVHSMFKTGKAPRLCEAWPIWTCVCVDTPHKHIEGSGIQVWSSPSTPSIACYQLL